MGDVHGAYRALKQVLERCKFDFENDQLIALGDIADGWSEVYECVDLLLGLKEQCTHPPIFIKGNHDDWTLTMMTTGVHPGLPQGGRATLDSYMKHCYDSTDYMVNMGIHFPEEHVKFFRYQDKYYKDDDNRIYVHGGFNRHILLKEHGDPTVFWWDRDLWMSALSWKAMQKGLVMRDPEYQEEYKFKIKEPCSEVFIGHTTTVNWSMNEEVTQAGIIVPKGTPCTIPMHAGPVWNLDTGAGFEGNLTIMDAETKQYWQSDKVEDLYPDEHGRRKKKA